MINILIADYHEPKHARDIMTLMSHYAEDPMGGSQPLSPFTQEGLIQELQAIDYALSILAYDGDTAVGLLNGFFGFSTFKCKPLLNIHDIVVLSGYRGQGISQKLLGCAEQIAIDKDCCKLTLEVLEGNHYAQKAYETYGFSGYELDPRMGKALFWEKPL